MYGTQLFMYTAWLYGGNSAPLLDKISSHDGPVAFERVKIRTVYNITAYNLNITYRAHNKLN